MGKSFAYAVNILHSELRQKSFPIIWKRDFFAIFVVLTIISRILVIIL